MNRWPLRSLLDPSGSLSPRLPLVDVLCRGHSHYGLCCSQHLGCGQLCLHPGQCWPWLYLSLSSDLLEAVNRAHSPQDKRQADGGIEAQTTCRMFISWLTTLAAMKPPFVRHHGNILCLETGARVLLPQLSSPSLASLLEFSSLAVQATSLGRSPPPLLRSSYPS